MTTTVSHFKSDLGHENSMNPRVVHGACHVMPPHAGENIVISFITLPEY